MDRDGVSEVIAMTVRECDEIAPLGFELALGAFRVAVQERVDIDALTARRVDTKGGMPEPGESRSHDGILNDPERRVPQRLDGERRGGVRRRVEDRLHDEERADRDDD